MNGFFEYLGHDHYGWVYHLIIGNGIRFIKNLFDRQKMKHENICLRR